MIALHRWFTVKCKDHFSLACASVYAEQWERIPSRIYVAQNLLGSLFSCTMIYEYHCMRLSHVELHACPMISGCMASISEIFLLRMLSVFFAEQKWIKYSVSEKKLYINQQKQKVKLYGSCSWDISKIFVTHGECFQGGRCSVDKTIWFCAGNN